MNTELHSLEEQWDKIPVGQIEAKLKSLLGDAMKDKQMNDEQTKALLYAYLARVQTLQLKMTLAGNSLQAAGPLLGARMDKSRVLFFLERGRWLIAQGKVEHGVDQWNNALHIAGIAGETKLAEEVKRLKGRYRDMVKITQAFTIEDMKSYVSSAISSY